MSSSRSSTARPSSAPRTPGGLRTLPASTSLSNVHIEAVPSTSNLQDRARSRRTLTRHLSSSNIHSDAHVGPSHPPISRNRSASTYTSSSSSTRDSGSRQAATPFRLSETTQSLYLGRAHATPAQKSLSRSNSNASIATTSRRTPLRSVSASSILYGSVRTPGKGTLSVPQLSTIEGSTADISANDWPQIAPPLPVDAMKRVAEARNATVEVQAKRHASSQATNVGHTAVAEVLSIKDGKAGEARAVTLGIEAAAQAPSSWTSYFGSTRKRRPSSTNVSTQIAVAKSHPRNTMPAQLEDVFKEPSIPTSTSLVDEAVRSTSTDGHSSKLSTLVPAKRKSYSSLRRSPDPSDAQQTSMSTRSQDRLSLMSVRPVDKSTALRDPEENGTGSAGQAPLAAGRWFWSSSSPWQSTATERSSADTLPLHASFGAPASPGSVEAIIKNSPADTVRIEGYQEESPSPSKRRSMEALNTWSSWLASYVNGKPVQTTSVTYGSGIEDSPQPSDTGTKASSMVSAYLPEADESFPEAKPSDTPAVPVTRHSPQTIMHTRSVLLDTVPPSTWSTFFTSRFASPHQRVTQFEHGQDEPDNMDVDFSQMTVTAATPRTKIAGSDALRYTGRIPKVTEAAPLSTAPSIPSAAPSANLDLSSASVPSSKLFKHTKVTVATSPMALQSSDDSMSTSGKVQSSHSAIGQTTSPATQSPLSSMPPKPNKPNLLLPSFDDTFHATPRNYVLSVAQQPVRLTQPALKRAVTAPLRYIFSAGSPKRVVAPSLPAALEETNRRDKRKLSVKSQRLPKALTVIGETPDLRKSGRVCVIGVHGWFIQSYLKNVVGEPTGTSTKFATMMRDAVKEYYIEQGVTILDDAITTIPLEGNGTVKDRLALLYNNLIRRQDWIEALNTADSIFIVAHSQGCIVSTLLIDRLINEVKDRVSREAEETAKRAYLYFETAAAKELFEFQNPESKLAQEYMASMQHVLDAGVKVLLVASLNDQVVPLYSGLFSSISHPLLLRTIFIDSQAFETGADFMTNLVVFSTKLRNAGISPHGLDFHLSEALAGSLMGVGHSTVYKESIVYKYAVRYLFETSGIMQPYDAKASDLSPPHFDVEAFDPRIPTNPYFLPWALRGIIDDEQIRANFEGELSKLREDFEQWLPKTKALQGVKMALEPLRGIPRRRADSSRSPSLHETEETGKDPKKSQAKL